MKKQRHSNQLTARILYIVREDGTDNYKVGVTRNAHSLKRRLCNLQAGNPRTLTLDYTYTFDVDGEAYATEQVLLRTYSTTGNEWITMPTIPCMTNTNTMVVLLRT